MIEKKRTKTGSTLTLAPFTNGSCQIAAEIISLHGTRRDAKITVIGLPVLTIADTAILLNGLRAMTEAVQKEMGAVQKRAAKKVAKR